MRDQFPRGFVLVAGALLLGVILGSAARAQQPVESGETSLVSETNLVNLTVTVVDAQGHNVSGLDKSDFAIYDNKQKQEIAWFALDDAPASIGIVFDLSGSMAKEKMAHARSALQRFFESSHPLDEYSLIGFDGRSQVLVKGTRDPELITQKLSFQPLLGQTALYDACRLAVQQVSHGAYRRHAILVISDGQDNNSRSTLSDLREQLKEDDVLVYAIGINDPARVGPAVRFGRNTLAEIASVTGGRAFFPFNKEDLVTAYEQIALELRSQYQVAYRPAPFTSERKWHQIKVSVKPAEPRARLVVHYKAGYYGQVTSSQQPATSNK